MRPVSDRATAEPALVAELIAAAVDQPGSCRRCSSPFRARRPSYRPPPRPSPTTVTLVVLDQAIAARRRGALPIVSTPPAGLSFVDVFEQLDRHRGRWRALVAVARHAADLAVRGRQRRGSARDDRSMDRRPVADGSITIRAAGYRPCRSRTKRWLACRGRGCVHWIADDRDVITRLLSSARCDGGMGRRVGRDNGALYWGACLDVGARYWAPGSSRQLAVGEA